MSDWNKKIIEEFRANEGKVGGNFEGADMLLLHTTGAKTGKVRVNPVLYVRDGDRLAVMASKAGAPTNPDWYHNILANPDVSVEVGSEEIQAHAEIVSEPKRTQLYEKMEAERPGFTDYKKKTSRTIPVVILTPKM